MRKPLPRTLLGKQSGLSSRQRVFRTAEAVEAEETEGYDVAVRRVFFDEVLLVTYHQTVGVGFVVAMLVVMSLFGFLGLALLIADTRAGIGVLLVLVPFALALFLRLLLKLDVITVYGLRTKAAVAFWFGKDEARRLYQQLARMARERQQRVRASLPVRRPPPVPSLPPPPPLESG
ncbi:MAG TPA: hypothetical protein VI589_16540 [Vicinamibacteria bacterium]